MGVAFASLCFSVYAYLHAINVIIPLPTCGGWNFCILQPFDLFLIWAWYLTLEETHTLERTREQGTTLSAASSFVHIIPRPDTGEGDRG